jgi:hypothetical protein
VDLRLFSEHILSNCWLNLILVWKKLKSKELKHFGFPTNGMRKKMRVDNSTNREECETGARERELER